MNGCTGRKAALWSARDTLLEAAYRTRQAAPPAKLSASHPSMRSCTVATLGGLLLVPALLQAQAGASRDLRPVPDPPAADTSAAPKAEEPKPVTVLAIAGEDGFQLRASDNSFTLRIRGGVQYDSRFFLDADDPAIDGFQVRRVRSDFQGTLYRDYDFRVYIDFAQSRVELLDAYLDARVSPALRVRVGKFKGPVGLERLQSVFDVTFAERGLPTSLVPNREVGVQVHGALLGGTVSYAAGVFNGAPDNSTDDVDTGDGKDVAGRLFLNPFRNTSVRPLQELGVGIAATRGEQEGTAAAPGLPTLRSSLGREPFLRFRGDGTAANTVVADGQRTRVSPQGYFYLGSFGSTAEYVRSVQEVRRGEAAGELASHAWQTTATYVLTGEPATYRGVTPARPFSPRAGSWGAVELAARASALEVDRDAFPLYADPARWSRSVEAWAVGVNWYLNRDVRVLVNYERTSFDAAAGGTARPAEQALVTRFQVAF